MKKIDEVSKKVKDSTEMVEKKVKEMLLPKVKGLETIIVATLVVMVVAGLVSGTGLMIVAGVLSAVILGLPFYSEKLSKMIPDKKEKKEKKPDVETSAEVKEEKTEE